MTKEAGSQAGMEGRQQARHGGRPGEARHAGQGKADTQGNEGRQAKTGKQVGQSK
jgi:hypothetical protein